MPIFRFSKAFSVGRGTKAFLNLQAGLTRGAVPGLEHPEELQRITIEHKMALRKLRNERQRGRKQRRELQEQRLEIFQLRNERNAMDQVAKNTHNVALGPHDSGEFEVGALPDFVIIGAQKCGTTSLYQLLTKHPNVQRAAVREIHYFDRPELVDKGTEWYRRCFPPPRWKNGRRSITGEKTPSYLFHPNAAEKMAEVVPQARLIVLLRNPVDRAYSHYRHETRLGRVVKTFEEMVEEEQTWLHGREHEPFEHQVRSSIEDRHGPNLLARGIYVDQLLRWRQFFDDEQMLVLKSENFYEHTTDALKLVQDFLDLPNRKLDLPTRRTKRRYEPMNPATKRRLEAFFQPHNQRLYEYLGVDFGW